MKNTKGHEEVNVEEEDEKKMKSEWLSEWASGGVNGDLWERNDCVCV